MIVMYFSVRDKQINAFMPPFACRTKGEAIRSLTDALSNKDHQFFKHSGDYDLYLLGTWDDETGGFTVIPPERVCGCLDLKPVE